MHDNAIAASIADSNFLSAGIQQLLTAAHLSTGTDWWQSIVLATFFVRLVTCPMAIMAVKNTYRMSAARPEMEQLAEWFKKESMSEGNVPRAREEYQQRMAGIWSKYNCNPLKSLASIAVQAPVFIGFFSALRAMAAHKVPSMTEGGMLWFSDLTLADPYYALPIISSLVFLTTIELGAADGMQGQDPKVMTRMKNFMRALAVIMVPLTASMPQSVFCYWITSNAFSLLQSIVLKVPAVKQALGLPDLTRAAASTGGAGPHIPVVTFSAPPRPQAKVQPKKIVTVFPEPVPRTGAKKKQKQ
ncbi:hypothetical protein WJX72_005000 [[Myrmecia] bisecta]|uniref:Membrane insertase YidC/Oxa/ALB C-terminal domain-containing protein n=1 Tax=[Myrmecia] bisecta TaxID=41462 RepID=A0AAW1PJR5_9CHLO